MTWSMAAASPTVRASVARAELRAVVPRQVYHPNLDLEGNVCLNILREEWKPILSVSAVVYGLQFLFLEPNADDPLNKAAAEVMMQNPTQFKRNVYSSMRGGYVDGVRFG